MATSTTNLNGQHSRSPSASTSNGDDKPGPSTTNGVASPVDSDDPVERLQKELEKTREEKDALAEQYNTLLARLTDMRTKLGTKLQQDAEELDRREQLIQTLTAQNDDLTATLETLKEELVTSHAEADRTSRELDALRTRALHDNAQESLQRERELREAQLELEKCRMERDEWERMAMQEKAIAEDAKSTIDGLQRDLDLEREAREREASLLEEEREKSANLQSVLLDFQSAKEHELKQAVKDYEAQVLQVTQSLAEYKHRAHTAELKLEENNTDITRTQELEKELKEKNLLIGKLRHEAVIINEHLVEALRRLRKNSSETNVDRRLVTNVVLSFLTTPRADSKRFEMLNLLASILQWTDSEREKAGLQRQGGPALSPPATGFWGRSLSSGPMHSPSRSPELPKSDETESFSRLWVEFLLTEASGDSASKNDAPAPTTRNGSLPNTPTSTTIPLSPPSNARRLPSVSSTNLPGLTSASRKGKEKEVPPGS
ncbi:hypothetical protein CC1G_07724 [Coprinopsis cinerea okayama7|uniref:GRIP domain-containing protein n=1 Tax=Coprinopsis cinerea (strain Okayama-7 / 130 / ATCC MYA-4618 / FGSC 9003) TaxID=240176 RepID=A8NBX7_COPC7|nr:hypothetical protein CC1G_07724 [Coprinopsis cinerea okayama7\|eukprot:XP_001832337.2 hypothetical protein CC1G_07724 [Coprinopsis cinerea okayama7\